MKNQIKAGYTMVPNKILDAILTFKSTGLKHEILQYMIRHTLGYHRESVVTTASAIASFICRNKAKTRQALHELIECKIVIADSKEGPGHTRRLSINYDIMQWSHNALPVDAGGYGPDQKCTTVKHENEDFSSKESLSKLYREGSSERAQMDTSYSDSGSIKESLPVSSESSQTGCSQNHAYIDGKNGNFCPKENIKENNKRNIYMYDITLIPPTLADRSGFKRAFNEWCIYRQEIEKPLTPLAIEIDMKKLLMLSSSEYSAGFNLRLPVIQ